ncbi:MAG: OmpA family protein, partial [Pseudomonadota bacterium]
MLVRFFAMCAILLAGVSIGQILAGLNLDLPKLAEVVSETEDLISIERPSDVQGAGQRLTIDASEQTRSGSTDQPVEPGQDEARKPKTDLGFVDQVTADLSGSLDGGAAGAGFEAIQIDPDGVSVFAGRAAGKARVHVLADGVVIGNATADADGNWIIVSEGLGISRDAVMTIETGDRPDLERKIAQVPEVDDPERSESQTTSTAVDDVNQRMMASLEKLVDDAKSAKTAKQKRARRETDAGDKPSGDGNDFAAETDDLPAGDAAPTGFVAGSVTRRIPVPVQFNYRTAEFTEQGQSAAQLLLDYLRATNTSRIVLSGHADERGSAALNMALSLQRLQAVRSFLKAAGYRGELVFEPKGEDEPFQGVDRSTFSQEDLYQLDRRVEIFLRERR